MLVAEEPLSKPRDSAAKVSLDELCVGEPPLGFGTARHVYGILGRSVERSPSPALHGGGYRSLGLSACYLPLRFDPRTTDLADVLAATLADGRRLDGLTVVSPNKERAIELADELSAEVRACGSSNVMVRRGNAWRAETTDTHGILEPLRRRGFVFEGSRAIVVGCGGSGRAAAAGLAAAGARVELVNRHRERGMFAARLLGLPWHEIDELSRMLSECDLVVNATPLGSHGEPSCFDPGALPPGATVVDLAYGTEPTPLVRQARAAGCGVVDGREVLVIQVSAQFRLMTGHALDEALAWRLAGWSTDAPRGEEPRP